MNIRECLGQAETLLEREKVPEAAASAEFLMAALLGVGRSDIALLQSRTLNPRDQSAFKRLIGQRLRRLPLAYILRDAPFMGVRLKITPDVLVPRPETEELAAEAFRLLGRRPLSFLAIDIGTGSGCLAVSLAAHFPTARVIATDISPRALALARENAAACGCSSQIRFIKEDLFGLDYLPAGQADAVLSNPPYIPSSQIPDLEPEVLHEPRLALDGGPDGLAAVKAIIRKAWRALKPGGFLLMEIGSGQAAAVLHSLEATGFIRLRALKDFGGIERIAAAEKPQPCIP